MKPEVQHIAITLADDSIAVMQFVTKAEFERDATDEAIEAEISKAGIAAQNWRRIDISDLPDDRTDRNAWIDDGKRIAVHPGKKAAIDAALAAVRNPVAEIDSLRAMIARADSLPDLQEAIVAEGMPNAKA